jgi:hypothetical protein
MENNIRKTVSFNTVLFVALVPDKEDRNGDIISADEIVKTAHKFMSDLQNKAVNIDHTDELVEDAQFVESYINLNDDNRDGVLIPK